VLKNGRIVGMIFAGAIDRAGIVFGLMKNGLSVDGFRERLLADDLGLMSLPRDLRQQMLQQA
jgi:NAD(P)H-nitrite reductase large subunit